MPDDPDATSSGAPALNETGDAQAPQPAEALDRGSEELKVFYPLGHYYSPLPDNRQLEKEPYRSRVWPKEPYETPGVDWRGRQQLDLCKYVLARQTPMKFPVEATADPAQYFTSNVIFPALDAYVLQAMLRHLRPARMIEVGCGYSSLVSARVNNDVLDGQMRFTCIDPYPQEFLAGGVPGISELRVEEIQSTPLELFEELNENDVLFIDTSHVVKTGGDVPWIFNQIIPRLNPGVAVHVHDMFLPGDYPSAWVLEGWGWNELYLMQSFLAFNSAFEVVFGVHWMIKHHRDALREAFPDLTDSQTNPESAASIWIRRTR
jgi:predicted O-methyltransferase YrrM